MSITEAHHVSVHKVRPHAEMIPVSVAGATEPEIDLRGTEPVINLTGHAETLDQHAYLAEQLHEAYMEGAPAVVIEGLHKAIRALHEPEVPKPIKIPTNHRRSSAPAHLSGKGRRIAITSGSLPTNHGRPVGRKY